MRLVAIHATGVPPVDLFSADDLSDVVVLAGPNGVGKTRLVNQFLQHLQNLNGQGSCHVVVEATCAEERAHWGQKRLVTSSQQDAQKLKSSLQQNRRRRNWKSSILNFESDRSIQQIQPYTFTWDIGDPYDEEIGWNTTFTPWRSRFQDTLHSMFRLIESQKRKIADQAIQLRRDGKDAMDLSFSDPLEPFSYVFEQLLGPKTLAEPNSRNQQLQYQQNGNIFGFNNLSSGEREVVNVAFDFLLRNPTDCVVFFDEPELHLHPELSYRLIRTLQNIGNNNQFVLCTHSPDIISAALEQSVIFVTPPGKTDDNSPRNQARMIAENDETNQALRLLGHSVGIISLGKKIVLIEGTQASLDKQTYGSIIKNRYPDLVLVPSEGKDLVTSFDVVAEKVLGQALWGVEFFMLCDGDSMPWPRQSGVNPSHAASKLRILDRYHLENYFLDEHIWERVFAEMESDDSWLRSSDKIRERIRQIARDSVSYAVALAVSGAVRHSVGNVSVMPKDCHGRSIGELHDLISQRADAEVRRVSEELDVNIIKEDIERRFKQINRSLEHDTDEWKKLIPGRSILNQFAAHAHLDVGRAKRMYIREAVQLEAGPFTDINDVFQTFSAYRAGGS